MDAAATSKPSRRWHQRRLVRYSAVLLAACVVGYVSWDALFMPADLRRLQGAWKVERELTDGQEGKLSFDRLVIARHRLEISSEEEDAVSCSFYIVPERREFCLYEEEETQILGLTVRLPIWLKRPSNVEIAHYDLGDDLVLRVDARTEIVLKRIE